MLTAIIIAAVTLLIVLPAAYASLIGAPFVPSSSSQIKDIVSAANVKNGGIVYELGAGNGRVMAAFAKGGNAKVIGFELAPVLYFIASINLVLKRAKNYRLYLKDFYAHPLNDADVVYFFLMPRTIARVAEKLSAELKPGAKVISYTFPIKGWTPRIVFGGGKQSKIFVYEIV